MLVVQCYYLIPTMYDPLPIYQYLHTKTRRCATCVRARALLLLLLLLLLLQLLLQLLLLLLLLL